MRQKLEQAALPLAERLKDLQAVKTELLESGKELPQNTLQAFDHVRRAMLVPEVSALITARGELAEIPVDGVGRLLVRREKPQGFFNTVSEDVTFYLLNTEGEMIAKGSHEAVRALALQADNLEIIEGRKLTHAVTTSDRSGTIRGRVSEIEYEDIPALETGLIISTKEENATRTTRVERRGRLGPTNRRTLADELARD
jgi:hypothetical protein